MAQAATSLAPNQSPTVFTNVEFLRPILVPDRGSTTIRVAALARESGSMEVAIRSESTSYQVDHFRANCHFLPVARMQALPVPSADDANGDCEFPAQELYNGLLFQRGRFQRLGKYRLLRATECLVEISTQAAKAWFGEYLPQHLVLGDPGARDAFIHAVQACIPHARLLPIGVDRIVFYPQENSGLCLVRGRERSADGNLLVYDIEVLTENGCLLESWQGLKLQRVAALALHDPWPATLLGPYVDRCVKELVPGSQARIVFESNQGERSRFSSDRLMQRSVGNELPVLRRADGKPCTADSYVSAAHTDGLIMAAAGPANLACDVEQVVPRSLQLWRDLLGADRAALAELIAKENSEAPDASATRVWAALECLKKAGMTLDTPLVLEGPHPRGWVKLRAGSTAIVTLVAAVANARNPLALAVLVDNSDEKNMDFRTANLGAADLGAGDLERSHSYAEGSHGV
jgi:enediyne polyketide synthase